MTLAPLLAALLGAGAASAQTSASPTPQFDSLGFIQAATLSSTMCPSLPQLLWGGTVTVNGIVMTVPCNTILQMPANTITWAQLFDAGVQQPVPATERSLNGSPQVPAHSATCDNTPEGTTPQTFAPGCQTGLAIADLQANFTGTGGLLPTPFPSFEIHAVGNIVPNAAGVDQYIIGLIVPISQEGLNAGAGKIQCIDYTNGWLYVGGSPLTPGTTACTAANGTKIEINDPIGRYGIPHSPDPRFSADVNNTTVHAGTGYPMCVPRVAPPAVDPLCPIANRPLNGDLRVIADGAVAGGGNTRIAPPDRFLANGAPVKILNFPPPPGQSFADPTGFPDSRQQAPFMVGDFITWSGTLAKDATGTTQSLRGQYVSANTVVANVAIFTYGGSQPAYVSVEELLLGTGGTPEFGIRGEFTTRIFVTGFTTDTLNLVDLNAIDVNPCTGVETLRLLGTLDPLAQPVKGRWRFHVLGGQFMPPTREMLAVSHTGTTVATAPGAGGLANGLGSGQYRVPNFTFIFPENVVIGEPILSNNFQDFPFLTHGSGPYGGVGTNPIVGQLTPWPGSQVPAAVSCSPAGTAPIVSAGVDFAVGTGLVEALAGTLTQDPNATLPTITWAQTAGPAVVLTNGNTLTPTFTTPAVAAGASVRLSFRLTVTDTFGTTTSTVNVTVLGTVTDALTAVGVTYRFPATLGQGVTACVGGGCGQTHKVGDKGGLLKLTATDSINSASIAVYAVGFGFLEIDPIAGLPAYSLDLSGTAIPNFVTFRTSLGAEATVQFAAFVLK
ncbi:MAG TPA: hypothetical protein VGH20_15370 [Myxococcales bacterium]